MVSLAAFDAGGKDITSSAIQGFASTTAVPEPGMALMLLSGVGLLAIASRRRQRALA